jgi:hypothetical protein
MISSGADAVIVIATVLEAAELPLELMAEIFAVPVCATSALRMMARS